MGLLDRVSASIEALDADFALIISRKIISSIAQRTVHLDILGAGALVGSLGRGAGRRGGAWPPDPPKHISTVPSTGKMPPRSQEGPRGFRLTAGTAYPLSMFS